MVAPCNEYTRWSGKSRTSLGGSRTAEAFGEDQTIYTATPNSSFISRADAVIDEIINQVAVG